MPSPEQQTTAVLNGVEQSVYQMHRWERRSGQGYEPVAVTVVAPIVLSVDDVAALLIQWWNDGVEDLTDDAMVLGMVAEAVVNEGCSGVEAAREAVTAVVGTSMWRYCRQRASTVLAGVNPLGVERAAV